MANTDSDALPETLNSLPGVRDEREALIELGPEGATTTRFETLAERVDRLAEGLRSGGDDSSGSGPEKVMLFAPASAAAITAVLAILRAGKIVVPVDTQMSDEDLVRVLENCEPQRVLTTQRLFKRLEELEDAPVRPECFALDKEGEPESWESLMADKGGNAAEVDADDMAVLFYISGTTGPPKGVPLSHRNLRTQLEAVQRSGLIVGDERVLLPLPLHHVYPFVIGMLAPNHVSYLDAPCLGLALGYQRVRRCFWAGGTNIMLGNPVMRAISKLAQVVPIDARRRPRSSLAFVALLLDRERPLVWFPEGGISEDGELQAFQPGLGVLLQQRNVPVVPVYIEGTYESLPRGRVWPGRSRVRVHFG